MFLEAWVAGEENRQRGDGTHRGRLADRSSTMLSGGQRQLVLLARALAQDTPLLLLDEPTASLDFGNQLLLWQTVRSLTAEGRTALICTHDPNHVLWFCDRALVLGRQGRLIEDGPVDAVVRDDLVRTLYGPVSEVVGHGEDTVVRPLARRAPDLVPPQVRAAAGRAPGGE